MDTSESINAALEHLKAGNLRQAEHIYKEILSFQPDNATALHFLGVIYYRYKNYDAATAHIRKALQLQPAYVEAYNNLGIILQELGELDEAIMCHQKAIHLNPAFIESCINLGNILQAKGLPDEALLYFQKALQMNPNLLELYINTGNIMQAKGLSDEAIRCYQKALELNPNCAGLYNNLGNVLLEKGQLDEAMLCFQKALEFDPNLVEPYINLGNILQAKGFPDEALACFQKAVQLSPNSAYTNYNLSLALLLSGNFREGLQKYEWRRKIKDLLYLQPDFSQPLWDGSDITGRTVLLLGEQGFGDIIQFIRYAPLVAQRNAKVIVVCHKELTSLIQNTDGISRVVGYGQQLPEFDVYCPLLSLPFIFSTTLESIPAKFPYIKANPSFTEKWRDIMRSDTSRLKIGIVWSGNPKNLKLRYKSSSLDMFSPFAQFDDISFYSLQKGEAAEQAKRAPKGLKLIDLTEEIQDFSDTAAFIGNLDLVISVDTAVAHLAGALGKPVWTLLPFMPDWRWLLNRQDSPWYPTMKLFRQFTSGDWKPVIAQMAKELAELCN